MKIRFQNPEVILEQLSDGLGTSKQAAEDLSTALTLLQQMQDSCLGMGIKIGGRNYTVTKEDDFFIFIDEE